MALYRVVYDIDRGSMMGDAVEVIAQATSPLRAVRLARVEVPHLTDCIDRQRLVALEVVDEAGSGKDRVITSSSDLFGRWHR